MLRGGRNGAAGRTAWIAAAVVLAAGLLAIVEARAVRLPGDQTGYAPEQPIAFSHQLHAGELAVPCLYCHADAERSRHAGVPPASTCMNCHRFVTATIEQRRAEEAAAKAEKREPRPVFSAEIRKVYRAMALGDDGKPDPALRPEPIRWVKVHDLPDFALIDHSRHVNGGVACEGCHGPVAQMERVRQEAPLSMGWCLTCHRASNVQAAASGKAPRASLDCAACHY